MSQSMHGIANKHTHSNKQAHRQLGLRLYVEGTFEPTRVRRQMMEMPKHALDTLQTVECVDEREATAFIRH